MQILAQQKVHTDLFEKFVTGLRLKIQCYQTFTKYVNVPIPLLVNERGEKHNVPKQRKFIFD